MLENAIHQLKGKILNKPTASLEITKEFNVKCSTDMCNPRTSFVIKESNKRKEIR